MKNGLLIKQTTLILPNMKIVHGTISQVLFRDIQRKCPPDKLGEYNFSLKGECDVHKMEGYTLNGNRWKMGESS